MGFLDKVRNGLKKTKESLIKNIETVVIGYAKIDDDFLEEDRKSTRLNSSH